MPKHALRQSRAVCRRSFAQQPTEVPALRWADLIQTEFLAQGDQERRLGLPLSPFADREKLRENFTRAEPFPHLVIDGFLDPAFCRELLAQFPPYDDARFRNEHGHRGKGYDENVRALLASATSRGQNGPGTVARSTPKKSRIFS